MPLGSEFLQLDSLTADPSSPVAGQVWYNSTAGELRTYRNGSVQEVRAQKDNVTTVAPTATDDGVAGYEVGSRWLNTTGPTEYVCVSSTTGSAVWLSTGGGGGNPSYNHTNAAGDITTTSTTDVAVTSMTLTPGAGTYIVTFSSDWSNASGNANMFASVFANGTKVTNSERQYSRGNQTLRATITLVCVATVAAGQAIDVRWRVSAGTGTMGNRSLTLLKVG